MARATIAKKAPRQCLAYGCGTEPKDGLDFCTKDLRRLPVALRDRAKVREAIVELAVKDGFLTPDPVPHHVVEIDRK